MNPSKHINNDPGFNILSTVITVLMLVLAALYIIDEVRSGKKWQATSVESPAVRQQPAFMLVDGECLTVYEPATGRVHACPPVNLRGSRTRRVAPGTSPLYIQDHPEEFGL